MRSLFVLFVLAIVPNASASEIVGEWSRGTSTLSVAQDGRFGWKVGERTTDGSWETSGALVSLDTPTGPMTYAYVVDDDRLTLMDTSGGRIVLERSDP